jgi:hypothetical protein
VYTEVCRLDSSEPADLGVGGVPGPPLAPRRGSVMPGRGGGDR